MERGESSEKASLKTRVAVIMQRRAIENRWQNEVWEPLGVLAGYEGDAKPRVLLDGPQLKQWIYPGHQIVLSLAEAEGYYHNVSSNEPCLFVLWRMEGETAVPQFVTASYDEASRWMDGGAQVDSVAMPPAMRVWLREFVEQNYRPEPKKRLRPQSFLAPKDRGPADGARRR